LQPKGSGAGGTLAPRKNTPHFDAHRFEKISNIVKQFKLSCGKAQSQFQGMEVRNSRFCAFIDAFTANTYIMVIISQPGVHTAATTLNIQNAREHFERFIPRSWM
jgi:Ras-related GTP-binding protein A/B